MKFLSRAALAVLATVGLVLGTGVIAAAAMPLEVPDPVPVIEISATSLNWLVVVQLLVIPVVLPALVGLVNRVTNWPPLAKRAALAALALASQLLTEIAQAAIAERAYDLWLALFLGVVAYAVAELTYQGFYKASLEADTALPEPVIEQPVDGGPAIATIQLSAPPPTIASKIAGTS